MQLADSLVSSLLDCFTPEVARRIIDFRPDASAEDRLVELRTKANDGTLTETESDEYKEFVDTLDFVAVLKTRLRRWLQQTGN